MNKLLLALAIFFFCSLTYGQTIEELYNSRNFEELIKFEKKTKKLTGDQLYMIGYAFSQLENDNKAIEFYDKAIEKGLDNGSVHFYKGLSLNYLKRYDDALVEIEKALKIEPSNQEYMNEKGMAFYYQGKLDKALEVFENAITLPKTYPAPYYWIAHIYHEKGEYTKALKLFYEAIENIPQDNFCYLPSLNSIGLLEYTVTKDYSKSVKAYLMSINLVPKNYDLYPKLIKAYNGAKEYSKADSIFGLMKIAFYNNELSEDDMTYKNAAIGEYYWNGRKLIVYKYFIEPKESLDISYKVYLFDEKGEKIERTFMVEKSSENSEGARHLLCEKDKIKGMHYTYPYGWKTDVIPLEDLEKAVGLILDGKLTYGAASKF